MKGIATAALIAVLVIALLAFGCGKKSPEQVATPPPPVTVTPPAEVPIIPEITQAEQTLEDLDTQDIDEIEKDVDALTLP